MTPLEKCLIEGLPVEDETKLDIWQEKMDAMLSQRRELNKKIAVWKKARDSLIHPSLVQQAKADLRPVLSACQSRIMEILSGSAEGFTIEEIEQALLENDYKYSHETVRTNLSRLKDFKIKKSGKRYHDILSDKANLPDLLPEAIQDIFDKSDTPLTTRDVYRLLVENGYDLSSHNKPVSRVSSLIFRMKESGKVVVDRKVNKTVYYKKP